MRELILLLRALNTSPVFCLNYKCKGGLLFYNKYRTGSGRKTNKKKGAEAPFYTI